MEFQINNPQFWRISGMKNPGRDYTLKINKEEKIRIPDELKERYNFVEDTELKLIPVRDGFIVKRTDPLLHNVYVEPTARCNLNCKTCVRKSWQEKPGDLKMEVYHKLIDGLKKFPSLNRISFWGIGEPLVHPETENMIKMAKEIGARTQLITNGILLDKTRAHKLLEAGLDSIVISIDGTSPETQANIRSGADLQLIKKNIKYLRKLRAERKINKPEIGIEFVIMKSNVHELKNLRKLAFEIGASFIFLTNLLPYTEEMKDEVLYSFSISRSRPEERTVHRPEVYLPPTDLKKDIINSIINVTSYSSSISTPQVPFDIGRGYCKFVEEGSISLRWDGAISPCIPLMHSYNYYVMDRKKHIQHFHVGNLKKDDLETIWYSSQFVDFRKKVKEFPFSECTQCSGCDMSISNEEDCHGNTFPVCGDCLWARGVIQCP